MRQTMRAHKGRLSVEDSRALTAYLHSFRRYPVLNRREAFNEFYARFAPWHVRILQTEERIHAVERALKEAVFEPERYEALQKRLRTLHRRRMRYSLGRDHYADPLICGNIRFAAMIAVRYAGKGIPVRDLVQESYFALRTALFKFKPELGNKFSTYAGWWVSQQMARYIQEHGNRRIVRPSPSFQSLVSRIYRQIAKFEHEHGREPTDEELAEGIALQKGEDRAKILKKIARVRPQLGLGKSVSLQTPIGSDAEGGLILQDLFQSEMLTPEEVYKARKMYGEHARKIKEWVSIAAALGDRDLAILFHRFGLNGHELKSLQELGDEFGISRERIRQLQNELLDLLGVSKEEVLWRLRSLHDLEDLLASF